MAALPSIDGEWNQGHEDSLNVILNCYCVNCNGSNATTTLLPTKVPLFREIIVTSIYCDDCGFRNSEVSFGGEIQVKGERLQLTLTNPDDLNRQLIKSDSCTLSIPAIDDLEIPPGTQKGTVSTIQGVLERAAENLEALQPERLRLGDVDNFHRCRNVISKLMLYSRGGEAEKDDDNDNGDIAITDIFPFDIILDDPAGNSFIENLLAPKDDPNLKSTKYWRTPNQDMMLGLQPSQQAIEQGSIDDDNPLHKNVANSAPNKANVSIDNADALGRQEVLKFSTICSNCHKPAETDMCVTDIPHFKEVVIMSLVCENCGYRSNEIKGGGAIPKHGNRITLKVENPDDLAREILKSDTAGLEIPEIDLELNEGGLDGVYTTVEGLLGKLKSRLTQANPFGTGDAAVKQHTTNDGGDFAAPSPIHVRYKEFLDKLQQMADGNLLPFTLIISDPLANSFIGPIAADAIALSLQAEKEGNNSCYEDYVDPRMEVEEFERSFEQNEILGLNDMKTEQYNTSVPSQYYGTDMLEEVPDRIRRLDIRGPDHPHIVGKAPVDNDTTVMGAASANFAVPSMGKRGKQAIVDSVAENPSERSVLCKVICDWECNDRDFFASAEYVGSKEGMVYKTGKRGLGYYSNRPLLQEWDQRVKE